MGQIVNVVERSSARPGIVRFDTNRALSGMGHERFVVDQPIEDNRPVDELARRIFARGGVAAVHINGGMITVDLEKGHPADGIADIIRGLYTFYVDAGEELAPDDPRVAVAARNQQLQSDYAAAAAETEAAAAKAEAEAEAAPAAPVAEDASAAPGEPAEASAAEASAAEGHGEVAAEPAEAPNEAEGTLQPSKIDPPADPPADAAGS